MDGWTTNKKESPVGFFDNNDTIHRANEFKDIPWDSLNPSDCFKDWSLGRGGYGFAEGTWNLQIFKSKDKKSSDCSCDIWEFPAALSEAINQLRSSAKTSGKSEIRHSILNALDIYSLLTPTASKTEGGD